MPWLLSRAWQPLCAATSEARSCPVGTALGRNAGGWGKCPQRASCCPKLTSRQAPVCLHKLRFVLGIESQVDVGNEEMGLLCLPLLSVCPSVSPHPSSSSGLQSLLPGWLGVNSHTILIQVHECLELQPQALSQASGVLIAATLILPLG